MIDRDSSIFKTLTDKVKLMTDEEIMDLLNYISEKEMNKIIDEWVECDGDLVRGIFPNGTFKLCCTARGNTGIIYSYRKNKWNQYEYCILENNKYTWINDNGYCKFYKLAI